MDTTRGHPSLRRSGYCERGCFHPHLHCVVPGGGVSPDHQRWISAKRKFLLPVKVLSQLFRRLILEALRKAHAAGTLQFFGELEPLRDSAAFARFLAPLQHKNWVVYAKPPFGGPAHVLEYLGRYTHRVAISNQRIRKFDDGLVSFDWKDYRDQQMKVMTVPAEEFIRLFLQHALPTGLQRIRYYGFLANCHRATQLELCRRLLATPYSDLLPTPTDYPNFSTRLRLCPRCHIGTMVQLQVLFPCSGPVPMLVDTS